MAFITLAVGPRVIREVCTGHEYQKQLAIRGASDDLRTLIETANRQNKVAVPICGVFELAIGDTDAIWEVHQAVGIQAEDFANLYALLANRPGVAVTFRW
ncbi:MAG TPA: hypothetical protein VGJ94_06735 [Syntrophorhabdaceae bacterium]|jgi:hypothetical protein